MKKMKKAAIYHFTDAEKRPNIYRDELDRLRRFAAEQGYEAADVFCDRKSGRKEYRRLLDRAEQYGVVVVKDLYHIDRRTTKCFRDVERFWDKGLTICTMEDGIFHGMAEPPLNEPLRVATYCCGADNVKAGLDLEAKVLALYAEKKTRWAITGQYADACSGISASDQKEGEQKELMELIKDKDKYDLILVQNLSAIHGRTAKFIRYREQLGKDIYSTREGLLKL